MKCQRQFRPKISKVKTSVTAQIQPVSNGFLTLSEGVSGYTPVR